ncbi:MAG: hypothetical protein DYH15_02980 [Nitrosomonas sp. PRO4]|nr:hypothetical protein [Nitrosomonas sp. PRO4]
MKINADEIYSKIIGAAEGAFEDGWDAVKTYAPAEFKKMSVQLAEIVENVALYEMDKTKGYSPETGKILFKMQKAACESVLVAVTHLTLTAVQKAINAILKTLKDVFGGVIATIV